MQPSIQTVPTFDFEIRSNLPERRNRFPNEQIAPTMDEVTTLMADMPIGEPTQNFDTVTSTDQHLASVDVTQAKTEPSAQSHNLDDVSKTVAIATNVLPIDRGTSMGNATGNRNIDKVSDAIGSIAARFDAIGKNV